MATPGTPGRDITRSLLRSLDSRRLRLILLPTEQCNFRCTYCYEDFALKQMSPALVTGVKRLLESRVPELSTLEVDWFGGEPLLAQAIVLEVSEFSQRLCEASGTRFRASATTNGSLLTPTLLSRLTTCGVREYQISLDGFGAVHDRTRKLRSGAGTFDQIWPNLLAAHDSALDFAVSLRVHMSPDNAQGLPELVEAIARTFGDDQRFSVFFKAVGRYGGPNDSETRVFTKAEARTLKSELEAILGVRFERRTITPSADYVCYAAQANSLVVRSDGRLAKCTVALNDPRNDVGTLNADGTVTVDAGRFQGWLFGIESKKASDLSCPYSQMKQESNLVTIRAAP